MLVSPCQQISYCYFPKFIQKCTKELFDRLNNNHDKLLVSDVGALNKLFDLINNNKIFPQITKCLT